MSEDTSVESAPAAPAVDLAEFDTAAGGEEGSVMEVRHPGTGEVLRHLDADGKPGRPFTITYYGSDSERIVKAARGSSDRRNQQQMRTRTVTLTAVQEKEDIELLVAATKEWDVVLGGVVPPSDPKEYRAAYTKYRWLFEQGNQFSGTRANFLKSE